MLDDGELIAQPLVFDALTARIAEIIGFRAIGLGGHQMAGHLAAMPEPLLSLEDVAQCTRRVTAAVPIPVMVDAGAGFGEPLHTGHTTRTLEHAGAASIHIEDQIFPKRAHYHKGHEHVIPIEDMTQKVRAAVASRTDPDFAIVARTDAMRTDGYDEGIRRGIAYAEAGADLVMIFPNNDEEARTAPGDLSDIPVVYVNSEGNRLGRPLLTTAAAAEYGYKVLAYALTVTTSAIGAVYETLTELARSGCLPADHDKATELREFLENTAVRLEAAYALEEQTVEHQATKRSR